MIRYALRPMPVRRAPMLGQALAPSVRVMVTDVNGRPVDGAEVRVGQVFLVPAGESGLYSGSVPGGPARIVVRKGEQVIAKDVNGVRGDENVYVQFPICFAQPLLTTAEAVAFGLGAALAVAGAVTKMKTAELGGEILIGASIWTALFRLSCL